ncbi:MAG: DUF1833 family protein [Nitrospirales bacterium]
MSRPITPAVLTSMLAQESAEGYVITLDLDHPTMTDPIRVCSHQTDFRSQGQTYLACPFQIDGPADSQDAPPQVPLSVQNVDRRIVQGVRSIPPGEGEMSVRMGVVTTRFPDVEEYGPFHFVMKTVRYTREVVTGELSFENILSRPVSWARFTPNDHQGMF